MDNLLFEEKIRPIVPQNIGWLESKLSNRVMDRLWSYIEKSKYDFTHKNTVKSINQSLAGNISLSLHLHDDEDWFYKNVLEKLCSEYAEYFDNLGNNYGVTKRHLYCLRGFWVNFQNKHEFNPLHKHSGCIYSFVIWMKIPYDYMEQHQIPISANSNTPCASNFEFNYLNILGEHKNFEYNLNKNSEGTILFFPSKLQHQVYPFFNCDESRISLSGNICLDTSSFIE